MSSSLLWKPVIPEKGHSLSTDLKFLLRKKYGSIVDIVLDDSDILYLSGLRDASSKTIKKEIQTLINAIEKVGRIKVWEQY